MHRRFLFPLAAGIVGLVAISPVLAAEPSPSAGGGSKPAKATTSSSSKGATSSTRVESGSGSSSGSSATTETTATSDSSATTATTAKSGPPATSATTAPAGSGSSSGSGTSSTTCAPPETDQGPAPQLGEQPQNHGASEAGSVDVERLSPTELRIAKATPNGGWTQQVTAPSGPRVSVKFTRQGQSPSLIRFAASMDQAGKMIHVRVTSCG